MAPFNSDNGVRVVIQVSDELLEAVEAADAAFEAALCTIRTLFRSS